MRLTPVRMVAGVVAFVGVQMPVPPAGAEAGLFSGACGLALAVTFSSPVGAVPGPGTHGFSGGGTCVVNGQPAPMTFSGTFSADPVTGFGCLGGVAHGDARFSVGTSGFPNPVVQLVIVNHGGVIDVTAFKLVSSFEGQAELVQRPTTTAACSTGGSVSSATWCGVVVFQDPDPPPAG